MDSEKLVERIMSEIEDAHAREDYRKWIETAARAAVRIVVEQCAKVADDEFKEGLAWEAAEIAKLIRSLSPEAKDQG